MRLFGSSLCVALAFVGCVPNSATTSRTRLAVSCEGRCEGLESIASLLADPSELDLSDLLRETRRLATDDANQALLGTLGVAAYPPVFVDRPQLSSMATDLEHRLGEDALATHVTSLRTEHLANSDDAFYAEFRFEVSPSVDNGWHNAWTLLVGGLGTSARRLGFEPFAKLDTRIVIAAPRQDTALDELASTRGFLLPRDLTDLRAMRPGDSFLLHGEGALGVNLGVGVPLLIANSAAASGYVVAVSAGLRTRIVGDLDVQLVRLENEEVIVDVGLLDVSSTSSALAVKDGWGASAFVQQDLEIANSNVDLARLVEGALKRQLNERLALIDPDRKDRPSRLSVVRIRFGLDESDPRLLAPALAAAMRGDVRLAQALSNRRDAGVRVEFDLLRSGTTPTMSSGIDLFGIRYYRDLLLTGNFPGSPTPGGVRSLLFETLHRGAGWFFESQGHSRVGLSGFAFGSTGAIRPPRELNLFLQLQQGSSGMPRDQLLDHVDGLLLATAGPTAFATIADPGAELQQFIATTCDGQALLGPCSTMVLADEFVVQLRESAMINFREAIAARDANIQTLMLQAAQLRLAAQAAHQDSAQAAVPRTSVVIDYRLDDGALTHILLNRTGADLRQAALAFVQAAAVSRGSMPKEQAEQAALAASAARPSMRAIEQAFDEAASDFARMLATENAVIETIGEIGSQTLEIRYQLNADGPRYAEATVESVLHARSRRVQRLFDELLLAAALLDPAPEQVVIYALLALVPSSRIDLRFDLQIDLSPQVFAHYVEAGYKAGRTDSYQKGAASESVAGGLFDVDEIIELK